VPSRQPRDIAGDGAWPRFKIGGTAMKQAIKNTINHVMARTPYLRGFILDRYPYMFEPNQLLTLCRWIDRVRDVPGIFVEAGCAYGYTTVFLKRYMRSIGLQRRYLALDTFSGFVGSHVDYEAQVRRKAIDYYNGSFAINSKGLVDRAFHWQGIDDVETVQCDVTEFRFDEPIAFCLLDIDLYLPIKQVLPRIHTALSTGGILVVDDCSPLDARWDGALQAFEEFVAEEQLERLIVDGKLGVIEKR
jgi:hypothetical protein